ncbi:ribosome silencing factor [Candidatus Sumerlaeota bacterium]
MIDAHKADDVLVLDLRGISNFTDFFVIGSGRTSAHLRAMQQEIVRELRGAGERLAHTESEFRDAEWLALDYGDVVVHLFQPDKRAFYALERLWGDSPPIGWPPITPAAKEQD